MGFWPSEADILADSFESSVPVPIQKQWQSSRLEGWGTRSTTITIKRKKILNLKVLTVKIITNHDTNDAWYGGLLHILKREQNGFEHRPPQSDPAATAGDGAAHINNNNNNNNNRRTSKQTNEAQKLIKQTDQIHFLCR